MTDAPTKRLPTVVDVARQANVSQGTVSRYLNGLPVREANRKRVAAAIDEMNYTRNAVASAMRATSRRMVGLLVPVFDGFHARLLGALAVGLSKQGIGTLTMGHDPNPKSLKEALAYFQVHRIDCIIINGATDCEAELHALEQQGVRIIVYDNLSNEPDFSSVTVNNRDVSCEAVTQLLETGHRDIGIICGDLRAWTARERLSGWRDAFAQAKIIPDESLVQVTNWTPEDGYNVFRSMCENGTMPTALYVAGYRMTVGVLRYCREVGIRIPEDLSIISFDDVELFEHANPPITAIDQPVEAMAKGINKILTQLVYDDEPGEVEHIVLPCTINMRGSIAKPRTHDPQKEAH